MNLSILSVVLLNGKSRIRFRFTRLNFELVFIGIFPHSTREEVDVDAGSDLRK